MRVTLGALVRLAGVVGLTACLLAVFLARTAPVPAHFRVAAPPAYEVINSYVLDTNAGGPRLLDTNTGAVSRFDLPDGDRVDFASCSPWRNEKGESQLVGRWVQQGSWAGNRVGKEFGLARYAVPGGRVIDQVPLEVVPASHPCWFPDNAARVLYAGGDGLLYRIDFEAPSGCLEDEYDETEHRPEQVDWVRPVVGSSLAIRDPVWPTDPRFGRRLMISLSVRPRPSDLRLTPDRLWWVRLDPTGRKVIEGAPLTDPEEPTPFTRADERFPVVTVNSEGRPVFGFLRQPQGSSLWELRVGPLHLDPKTGVPSVRTEECRTMTRSHMAAMPSFSADGRSIYGFVDDHHLGSSVNSRIVSFPVILPGDTASTTTAARPGPPRG